MRLLRTICIYTVCLLAAGLSSLEGATQRNIFQDVQNGIPQSSGGPVSDSIVRRDKNEDSLTITFRYLDTAGRFRIDSSVLDFYARFPIPFRHQYMGNMGSAAQPLLFRPRTASGFDPGLHAFDAYRFTTENARIYTTTRPYTELAYILGGGGQQFIELLHTQNLKPSWNVSIRYRLINSPGAFNNQNTNHNNYGVTCWYESPGKRYNNFLVITGNRLQASENGGIRTDADYLNDAAFGDLTGIPTLLASGRTRGRGGLLGNTSINTGNKYAETRIVLRQQYDLGRKDSLVTDSTVIPLFYPRIRLEHTLTYGQYKYVFADAVPDSSIYDSVFGLKLTNPDTTILLRDIWKELTNDFSIYTFPVANNLNQFIKIGASYQHLKGYARDTMTYNNIWVHGEYRNRTRNQKWDALAAAELYLTGYNRGDFHVQLRLQRLLGARLGSLQVGFENSNRTPSFIYDTRSNFYLQPTPETFFKENSSRFFAHVFNPRWRIQLGAEYFLVTNYLYVTRYFDLQQENAVFNLLRLQGKKSFKVYRKWGLDAELYLQQQAGNAAVHVPLVFSILRFAYQGNIGFKNLNMAAGIEARYASPYKADNYSPLIGQFSYQDSTQLRNRPDINAFVHFRIRGFKAFIRAENLNTLRFSSPAGFKQYNRAAPGYPYPGMVLRFGFFWSFVN
ncbi:MAG: hypothetical protein EOO15_02130 [Chitinophagaceae bacterium]|nr:MAG: hypothetical protein EOO15_02130 [Chitinophagaceae bacterium]